MEFECGIFDMKNMDGTSHETQLFVSTICIPNRFQFRVMVCWVSLLSFLCACVSFFFFKSMYNSKGAMTIPGTTLFLSLLISISLLLHQVSYLANWKGFIRVIPFGLPMSLLVLAVTFVLREWFSAVFVIPSFSKKGFNEQIKLYFYLFNSVFQSVYWCLFFVAAFLFQQSNFLLYNLFISLVLLWLGLGAFAIGFFVFFFGRSIATKLSKNCQELNSASKSISDTISKVKRYSFFQATIWIGGGGGGIGIGTWGIIAFFKSSSVKYYFYLLNFWLLPSMAVACCLLVYSSVTTNKSSSSYNSSSKQDHENSTKKSVHISVLESSDKVEEFVQSMSVEVAEE